MFRDRVAAAPARQRGLTLVATVFILLILILIGLAVIRIANVQRTSVALDAQTSQAVMAARAGLQHGSYQAIRNATCAASTNLTVGAFGVSVTCAQTNHSEGGDTINLYRLVATACNQPSGGSCPNNAPGARYVERQLSSTVANQP
jgi:MSHA biogenesis protein MshP